MNLKLSDSGHHYDQLLREVPVGVYIWHFYADGTMGFEYVSPRFCEIFDLNSDAVLDDYQLAFSAAHPDDVDRLIHDNEHARITMTPLRWEGRFIICNEIRWISIASNPDVQPNGDSTWFGVVSDITENKWVDDALRQSDFKFQFAMDASPVPYALNDENQNIIYLNKSFVQTFGYTLNDMPTLDDWWPKAYPDPKYRQWVATAWQVNMDKAIEEGVAFAPLELEICCKDGTVRTVLVSASSLTGAFEGTHLVVLYDITERKNIEHILNKRELHLEMSQRLATLGSWEWTFEDNSGHVSNTWKELFAIDVIDDSQVLELLVAASHPDDRNAVHLSMEESQRTGESNDIEYRIILPDGQERNIHAICNVEIDSNGKPVRMYGIVQDVTDKKQSDDLIWKQANFDSLTALPNRNMFYDRLKQEMMKSVRSDIPLALMLIDLDEFKEVNDTLGHDAGDILLKNAAQRITECVRETDTVARLGGDEFVVLLSQLADINHADDIAQKIIDQLIKPFHLGNDVTYVSGSVGITLYPNDANNIESLMKNADQAMYLSKHLGKNRFSYFTSALQETAQKRLRMTNDLRVALATNQFQVYYQPIVEMTTGRIYKAEALIRWHHPDRGLVSPDEFIPLAEETGLIIDIGNWVFEQAAHQVKQWRSQFNESFQISVNRSPVEFQEHGLKKQGLPCIDFLNEIELSGESIALEITEGLLLNAMHTNVQYTLEQFRDAGIQVSLDDFGTGYSSLAYLNKLDIDYLKIDKSFVDNLINDASARTLCEAIIIMANTLGLKVIAEGVESEGQQKILADAGCDYAQGYLFSRPVPPEEFEKLITILVADN